MPLNPNQPTSLLQRGTLRSAVKFYFDTTRIQYSNMEIQHSSVISNWMAKEWKLSMADQFTKERINSSSITIELSNEKDVFFAFVCCTQLRLVRLVGIMLVIFVRDIYYDLVRECSAQYVGTGLLGMMVCTEIH